MHDVLPCSTDAPVAPAPSQADAAAGNWHALAPGQRFIAADVGGTHARLGWVEVEPGQQVHVHEFHQYACAGYPSLAAILRDFAARVGAGSIAHAVIAIAGRLDGDVLLNSNLPWPVSLSHTRREAGIGQLVLINDFQAVACAMPYLERTAMTRVCGEDRVTGPALVLGPGTGLGAALWLPDSPPRVLASEAGHAALAVGNARELALLSQLLQRWPHVDNERVLSGPGLVNAYRGLCELDGVAPLLETPAQVSSAAQAGEDPQAREALSLFCGLLGSMAGDLALTFGAGVVYLAGGIPAQIKPFLLGSDFAVRFANKGVLGGMLAEVPVYLVEHGQLGLIGAAAWYREHHGAH